MSRSTGSPRSLAASERAELSNTALEIGAEAGTLCGDWDVRDLVVHLLLRERNPLAGAALVIPPLRPVADSASRRLARHDFTALVERFRAGPPPWSVFAIPGVDARANALEFFVHHEDIRRAQPDWAPRDLAEDQRRALFAGLRLAGRLLLRSAGVPIRIQADDDPHRPAAATLRSGPEEDTVTIAGPVGELVLFTFGRDQTTELRFSGPPAHVARVRDSERRA